MITNSTSTPRPDVDFDIAAYLQKRASTGLMLYNNRYFMTDGHLLKIYLAKPSIRAVQEEPTIFDICAITSIDKDCKNQTFVIYFMNNKFKLDVKAASDEQRKEWCSVLEAKRSLYSIDELRVDVTGDRLLFKTKTFNSLMVLKEQEQNNWIMDRLDDAFAAVHESTPTRELLNFSPVLLIRAAESTVHDLLASCKECEQEITSRNPKVIAHCRDYMRRYAESLKGRISLELLAIPGVAEKNYEALGEKCICAAMEFIATVDSLSGYDFLPPDLVPTFNSALWSSGELISTLLNLSIQRVDAFFSSLRQLPPELRSVRLPDFFEKVVGQSLEAIQIQLGDAQETIKTVGLVTSKVRCSV